MAAAAQRMRDLPGCFAAAAGAGGAPSLRLEALLRCLALWLRCQQRLAALGHEGVPPPPALADALYGRPRLSDDELEAVNSGGASLVSFRVKEMHALVP